MTQLKTRMARVAWSLASLAAMAAASAPASSGTGDRSWHGAEPLDKEADVVC